MSAKTGPKPKTATRNYVRELWERRAEFGWETKLAMANDLSSRKLIIPGTTGNTCLSPGAYLMMLQPEKK
jgi:hypothetical protein